MALNCEPMRRARSFSCLALIACLASPAAAPEEDDYAALRARHARADRAGRRRDCGARPGGPRFSERVLDALEAVPRHRFVPARETANAYENRPLPIGHGQTISQPYIVALMTELLALRPATACSRSAPARATRPRCSRSSARTVYTIEIVEPLARERAARLAAPRLRQRRGPPRRRLPRLARACALRRDHRDRGGRRDSATARRAADARRPDGHPGRRAILGAGADRARQGRQGKVSTRSVLPVAFVPLTGSR